MVGGVFIRTANPADDAAVRAVVVAANEQYLERTATSHPFTGLLDYLAHREYIVPGVHVVVAEDGGDVAGSVTYVPVGPSDEKQGLPDEWAVIRLLGVSPKFRGRGIGRVLTEYCIDRAREEGATTVGLTTHQRMEVARSMYVRLGFERAPEYDWRPDPETHVEAFRLDLSS